MVAWFHRVKTPLVGIKKKMNLPDGMWIRCDRCREIIYISEFENNAKVCPRCNYHYRISAMERIRLLLDEGSFQESDRDMVSTDPLRFKDTMKYKDRLKKASKKTNLKDAIVCGAGTINRHNIEICVFEFEFMGGSMGSVVGEKIARGIERSIHKNVPILIVSCSGGARMQEGILSLMQLAKTSAALARLSDARIPFLSILTDPTTGGVTASVAMLGDIIIAEPEALICFAGPRVIEQTIKQKLPDGFQRSEFLLEHGFVDMIVHRKDMKSTISKILDFFGSP
ncbi:MAG: acetyl-CoA carboxylase carboxyltransferase subunit beta [Nitrospinae bacterium]|nr:acetyl-CoA carboxylase carboxyltransferase subunit beta [Nitrospinota bacterium]